MCVCVCVRGGKRIELEPVIRLVRHGEGWLVSFGVLATWILTELGSPVVRKIRNISRKDQGDSLDQDMLQNFKI